MDVLSQAIGPSTPVLGLRHFETGPGGERLPPSVNERELFPLPILYEASTAGFSRRCRRNPAAEFAH